MAASTLPEAFNGPLNPNCRPTSIRLFAQHRFALHPVGLVRKRCERTDGGGRFQAQIQFALHDAIKMFDHFGRTQTPRAGRKYLDSAGRIISARKLRA